MFCRESLQSCPSEIDAIGPPQRRLNLWCRLPGALSRSCIEDVVQGFSYMGWTFLCDHLLCRTSSVPCDNLLHSPISQDNVVDIWIQLSRNWGSYLLHLLARLVISILDTHSAQERTPRTSSCVVVIDISARCCIAQCRFVIVMWWHQVRARACWTVIKRHREIEWDGYFMKTVDRRDFRYGILMRFNQ